MIKSTLSIFLIFFALLCNAQKNAGTKTSMFNDKSIVRGEDGMVYTTEIWKKLLRTGKYSIKSRNTTAENGEPEWLIYELTDKEHQILMDKMPKPRASDSFVEGSKFNGFKTSDMNGNRYDLKNAAGKVIVLNFWFINCPPCKAEIPELNNLVDNYKSNSDIIFLAIALDDKYELQDFLKQTPYNYNIVNSGRYIAERFGVKSYPTHVVVDKTGTIKFSTLGLAPNTIAWIKKSIDESLNPN
ncbi:TlpA family protein disulfide reductase [Pedobacter lithocola]|uniref:TlpA family protein disulfide reductase n=1 Tax=Pedobacter lithocola TaxID=1908239 RepID=A0ABV8P957_9SPHI